MTINASGTSGAVNIQNFGSLTLFQNTNDVITLVNAAIGSGTQPVLNVNFGAINRQTGSVLNITLPAAYPLVTLSTTGGTTGQILTDVNGTAFAVVGPAGTPTDWAGINTVNGIKYIQPGSNIPGFYTPNAFGAGFNTDMTNSFTTSSATTNSIRDITGAALTITLNPNFTNTTITTGGILHVAAANDTLSIVGVQGIASNILAGGNEFVIFTSTSNVVIGAVANPTGAVLANNPSGANGTTVANLTTSGNFTVQINSIPTYTGTTNVASTGTLQWQFVSLTPFVPVTLSTTAININGPMNFNSANGIVQVFAPITGNSSGQLNFGTAGTAVPTVTILSPTTNGLSGGTPTSNTYTGTTGIFAGIVQLGTTAGVYGTGATPVYALPQFTSLNMGGTILAPAVLDLHGNSQAVGQLLSGGGNGALAGVAPTTGYPNNVITNLGTGPSTLTVGTFSNTSSAANSVFYGFIQDGTGTTNNASSTVALVKTGAGMLTLTGPNNYSGGTTVNGGTLVIQGPTGAAGYAAASLGSTNAITGLFGSLTVVNNQNATSTGTTVVLALAMPAQSVGSLNPGIAAGTLVNPLGGTITVPSSGFNTAQISLASTALTINQTTAGNWGGNITGTGSIVYNSTNSVLTMSGAFTTSTGTLAGQVIQTPSFSPNYSGLQAGVTLLSTNDYTGSTTINGGTISVNILTVEGAAGGVGSGIGASGNSAANLILNGGTLQYANPVTTYSALTATTDRLFTVGANGGTLDASAGGAPANSGGTVFWTNTGSIAFSGVNTSQTLNLTGTGTGSFAPSLSDNGTGVSTLNKAGTGTWLIVGANSYSGNTNIQNGTLVLGTQSGVITGSLSSSTNVVLGSAPSTGGIFQLGDASNPVNQTIASLTTLGSGTNRVVGGNSAVSTLTVANSGADLYGGFLGGPTGNQNNLALIMAGTGNLTLSAANTFNGGTSINSGTLTVTNASGGVASALGTGSLTIAAGANFVQAYNTPSVQTTQSLTSLTIGAASGSAANLTFEIGNAATGTDKLAITGAGNATVNSSGAAIIITATGATLTPGAYTLISTSSGSLIGASNFSLATPSLLVGSTYYILSLSNTPTTENLNVTTATTFYWAGGTGSGTQQASWNTNNTGSTNWRTSVGGNVDPGTVPGPTANVFFSTSTPVASNFTTTLDANFTVNSVNFTNVGGSVSINNGAGGPWTLTINNGIVMFNGAAAATINAAVALGGSQSWTNSSANLLTIAGSITGSGTQTLTLAGSGSILVGGNISTSGTLNLAASGTVTANINGSVALGGATQSWTNNSTNLLTVAGNVTGAGAQVLTLAGSGSILVSGNISTSGALNLATNGTVTAILTGAANGSSLTTIGSGSTLQIGNGGTTGTLGGGLVTDNGSLVINRNNAYAIGAANAVSGTGSITQAGPGNTTLSAVNNYSGGTFVTGGTLTVSNTSALSGGALTIGVGTSFVQSNGAPATQNVSSLTVGAGSGAAATLTFELGNAATGTDRLNITGAGSATIGASGANIVIANLAVTSLTPGSYALITTSGGSLTGPGNFTLSTTNLFVNGNFYNLSLSSTATVESLNVTSASNFYWAGGTGSGAQQASWSTNLSNVTNWRSDATSNINAGGVPGSNAVVVFSTSNPVASNLTTTLDANFVITGLIFTSTGGSVTINSGAGTNTLTIGGSISMQAGAPGAIINAGVILGASQIWSNSSTTGALVVNGSITGSGTQSLTLTGPGAITLGGNIGASVVNLTIAGTGATTLSGSGNAYTGTTTISGGSLTVSSTGSIGTGALVMANTNTAQPGTQVGLFLFNSVTIGTLTGSISNSPSVGNTEVIYVDTGRTLTVTQTTNTATTFAGSIFGPGSLAVTASGATNNTLILSGNSSYGGSTTIGGTAVIQLGVANALPVTTALTVGGTATLAMNNFAQSVGGLSGTGSVTTGGASGILTITGTSIFGGAISGSGGLTLNGAGATLTLGGISSYTGATTIQAGTLMVGVANPFGPSSTTVTSLTLANSASVAVNMNNLNLTIGFLQGGGSSGGNISTGTGAGGTLFVNTPTGVTTTYASVISGNGGLTLDANNFGTLILTGHNTYFGATVIDPGTLRLFVNNGLPTTTALVVQTGGTFDLNTFQQTVASLSDGNTSGGVVQTGVTATTGLLTIANSSAITSFAGSITEAGGLTLDSTYTGTLTLAGANTYTGNTSIQNGTLVLGTFTGATTGSLSSSTNVILGSSTANTSGTFQLGDASNPVNQTIAGLTAVGTGTSNAVIGGNSAISTLTISTASTDTYSGVLGGSGTNQNNLALSLTGGGVLTLTGANTYVGNTAIQNGTLVLGTSSGSATGSLSASTNVILGSATGPTSGIFQLGDAANPVNQTVASLTVAGSTSNAVVGGNLTSVSTLTVAPATGITDVYSGFLGGATTTQNNLALVVAGTGTGDLTLSAANTYTGGTTIMSGTLTVTNAVSGVASALGAGSLTIAAGANFVQAYNTPTVQTTQSLTSLTIGAASGSAANLTFEIGNAATGTDKLAVSTTTTVGASTANILITNLATTYIAVGTYTLISNSSPMTGASNFTLGTPTTTVGPVTYTFTLATQGNNEVLTVAATTTTTAYWAGGATGGPASWSTVVTGGPSGNVTNWRTDATSNIDTQVVPSSTTNVFFSTSNPVAGNLATTLDASFAINSLTFTNVGGSVSISSGSGSNTLTINGGITMNSGAAGATINAAVALGASQAWTNNSGNLLTVAGNITGSGTQTLTVNGSGNTTLSGSISSSGTLNLSVGTSGTVLLAGTNTYSGTTSVTSGTLQIGGMGGPERHLRRDHQQWRHDGPQRQQPDGHAGHEPEWPVQRHDRRPDQQHRVGDLRRRHHAADCQQRRRRRQPHVEQFDQRRLRPNDGRDRHGDPDRRRQRLDHDDHRRRQHAANRQ